MAEQEQSLLSTSQTLIEPAEQVENSKQAEQTEDIEQAQPHSVEPVDAALETKREGNSEPASQVEQPRPSTRGKRKTSTTTAGRSSSRKPAQSGDGVGSTSTRSSARKRAQLSDGGDSSAPVEQPSATKPKTPRKKSTRATPAKAAKTPGAAETSNASEAPALSASLEASETTETIEKVPAEVAPAEVVGTVEETPPKKPTRARKTTGEKPRASRARKKPAPVAEAIEVAEVVERSKIDGVTEAIEVAEIGETAAPVEVQSDVEPLEPAAPLQAVEQPEATATIEEPVEREFEPELDVTPVRPRQARTAERREALFSDLVTEAPAPETDTETSIAEMEETLKRPSMRLRPLIDMPVTRTIPATNGHVVAPFEPELNVTPKRETGQLFTGENITVAERPIMPGISKTPPPGPDAVAKALATTTIPVTPVPSAIEEEKPLSRPIKGRIAVVLLLMIVLCIASLWHDVSDTHLYLYSINPLNGQARVQQDLGGGYSGASLLTNPVLLQSSLLVGVPGSQRILSLSGGDGGWGIENQIQVSLPHQTQSTLSVAPNHDLVVAYAGGIQVMTPAGSLLWQVQDNAPAQGAHAFAPAFDATTLYTVRDAGKGIIAAYSLNSGAVSWSQQLDDSFNFSPPVLLYGETLFVAGDHSLYALDRADGTLRWKASMPGRTLLIDQATQPVLIAAGAAGLTAFDTQSGTIAWTFNGHLGAPGTGTTLADAQLYQASLSPANQVVYATGIVWDEQQAREQLWLFAVDASSGGLRWSEPVGADIASADAGRILAPFVDDAHGLVLLEVAQGDGSHTLSAYDTGSGAPRWSTRLAGVTAFAPTLFQAANDSISLFAAQSDTGTALHSRAWLRLLLLAVSILSILLLVGLWLVPLKSWRARTSTALNMPRSRLGVLAGLPKRWWKGKRARLLATGCLIAIVVGAGTLTFVSLNHPQQYLNAVDASSGSQQWQRALDTPAALSGADGQESFVVTNTSSALTVLSALNSDGSERWSTPASEGTYSLPLAQTAPGTLLVALSGPASPHYTYALGDTGYLLPVAHLFSLSLLNSATGRAIWQTTIIRGNTAQDTVVLGADAQFIYVASRSIPLAGQAAVVQLVAVDSLSGAIAWRIYGAREDGAVTPDFGALLPHGRLLFWQVAGTIYALDTQLGQIQWRTPITEVNATSALLEESQMALDGGVLLIRRSDQYHALNLATGSILWSIGGLGSATPQSPGGMLVANGAFILYGSDTIEALNPASQALLWRHNNLATITNAVASPDGSLVYAIVEDSQDGNAQQALVAFNVKDSSIRWTFQPSGQALFIYPGAPQLRLAHGMLFVTLCMPPGSSGTSQCGSQVLYALNGTTGGISWKFGADRVTSVQVSKDGVVFQTSSSAWENFKERFQG